MKKILLTLFFFLSIVKNYAQETYLILNPEKNAALIQVCSVPDIDCDYYLNTGYDRINELSFAAYIPHGKVIIFYDNHRITKTESHLNYAFATDQNYIKRIKDSLKIYCIAYYKDEMKTGKWKFYTEKGKLRKEIEFRNDTLISWKSYEYYKNGNTFFEVTLTGLKSFRAEYFNLNSNLKSFLYSEGTVKCWHNNKQLYYTGRFKNRQKTGEWNVFNRDGKQIKHIIYNEVGEEIKGYANYYKNDKIWIEVKKKDTLTVTEYYSNGQLKSNRKLYNDNNNSIFPYHIIQYDTANLSIPYIHIHHKLYYTRYADNGLSWLNSDSYTIESTEWYEDGTLQKKVFPGQSTTDLYPVNDTLEISYYPNRQLKSFITRTFGTEWYSDGSFKSKTYRSNIDGIVPVSREWYENKQLKSITTGSGVGLKKEWYPDGTIKSESKYIPFGKGINTHMEFNTKGERVSFYYYENSNVIFYEDLKQRSYYNNKIAEEERLKKDTLNYYKAIKLKFDNFVRIPSGILKTTLSDCDSIKINSFLIQKTEVSNKQYREFTDILIRDSILVLGPEYIMPELYPDTTAIKSISINGKQISLGEYYTNPKYNDYPVVGIDWFAARYYCEWLKQKINQNLKDKSLAKYIKVDLPTQTEWEYAFSEGKGIEHFLKNKIEIVKGKNFNNSNDKYIHYAPVKSFHPNKFGLYNMSGNVSEWCLDAYGNEHFRLYYKRIIRPLSRNPLIENDNDPFKVIMGGSFNDSVISVISKQFRSYHLQDSTRYICKDQLNYNKESDRYEYNFSGNSLPPDVGFRPVIYFISPEGKQGEAIDCEWIEF